MIKLSGEISMKKRMIAEKKMKDISKELIRYESLS